jgi:acyl dehydratase
MTAQNLPPVPFRIGERFSKPLVLDAESIGEFATMVGDPNPLHLDESAARDSRFGGLIASAAQTSALMTAFTAHFVTERAPGLGLEMNYRFRRAVKCGDPLLIVWEVSAIEPKPKLNGYIVTFTGSLTDSAGEIGVSGEVKTLVMPASPGAR